MKSLEHRRLLELLHYDPAKGIFVWKKQRSQMPAGSLAGTPHNCGYWHINVAGQLYLAHRLAWFYVTGKWPTNQIDHINGDRRDNRFENLRLANGSQNNANARLRKDSSSGFKGVSFHKQRRMWRSTICIDGKQKHLGLFSTPEEGHVAYMQAASQAFGEFSRAV